MADEGGAGVEGEAVVATPANGNGTRVLMHRDTLMGRVLGGCIGGLLCLGVLSACIPPSDWNVFNRVVDVLTFVIGNILGGHFALSRAAK